jgi:hypothetical protein
MLQCFSDGLGCGYDIGCKFKMTLNNSPLGSTACKKHHQCLVGAFHGHTHNRICQLDHLATYINGLGLEDLEGCERMFSKSNSLAGSVRYASIFHWKQAITAYFEHNDNFEVYQNLCKWFVGMPHYDVMLMCQCSEIYAQQLWANTWNFG